MRGSLLARSIGSARHVQNMVKRRDGHLSMAARKAVSHWLDQPLDDQAKFVQDLIEKAIQTVIISGEFGGGVLNPRVQIITVELDDTATLMSEGQGSVDRIRGTEDRRRQPLFLRWPARSACRSWSSG